tara:strand:- start:1526 stop:1678 length:153 start_codon:yes stop_codon:yes gene_type:complete
MAKHVKKIRINVTIKPDLLKRIDEIATPYERSHFICQACIEKLDREKDKE